MKSLALGLAGLLLPLSVEAAEMKSVYTDIDFDQCTTIESDDTGAMSACPGYKGFPLIIGEGDLRMFVSYGISATTEKAAEQTLPPFNHLGKKMEWRIAVDGDSFTPLATITRWYTQREESQDEGQVLVVTQLKLGAVCHIAYIDALAVKDANETARRIADEKAGTFDCANEPEIVGKFEAWKLE